MHSIVFKNVESDWNEALPLGNGIFGGMGYFRKNTYQLALNHYEVYYTLYHRYSHGFLEDPRPVRPGVYRSRYQETKAAAEKNRPRSGEDPYLHYRRTIWPTADLPRQAELQNGVSHPPTGEAAFHLGEALAEAEDFSLRLDIEDAALRLRVRKGEAVLSAETVVLSDADAALTRISQSEAGLLESLTLGYPQRRNHEGFAVSWEQKAPDTFLCRVSFYPEGEDREKYPPFSFAVVHRLMGAEGEGAVEGTAMNVRILRAGKKVSLLSYVLTELSAPEELEQTALAAAEKLAAALPERLEAHRAHWKEFFSRSRIALPDPVVERLWYLNLYVLRCSSGRGGKRFEQASGLNGLWDIRQPTMWGSLWYWDVNIEASYWPVYTANHLELAEVFNDGFLSYVPEAERRAREYYGMRGCAMDYPHTFYNCMWPWCAQYLWWYYEYSGDRDFLRERAYPLFRSLALFIKDVMEWDPETGTWGFFPDVSPEQGPITRNSTITLATVKYLLKIALKANGILKAGEEDAALFRKLLERVPPYSTAVLDRYGQVLKDSEYAPARIRLRHPSLLMPIFPLSELGPDSGLARNTVFFASENTEIGVFPFGWISAAAARLGMGNTALRVLYEQGIDLIVRNNGMGAEETERWVNHCIVDSGHFYQPFMMECVGETVNCVNEMLLQSYDGVIRVFPAVPNGDPETFRFRGRRFRTTTPGKTIRLFTGGPAASTASWPRAALRFRPGWRRESLAGFSSAVSGAGRPPCSFRILWPESRCFSAENRFPPRRRQAFCALKRFPAACTPWGSCRRSGGCRRRMSSATAPIWNGKTSSERRRTPRCSRPWTPSSATITWPTTGTGPFWPIASTSEYPFRSFPRTRRGAKRTCPSSGSPRRSAGAAGWASVLPEEPFRRRTPGRGSTFSGTAFSAVRRWSS